MLIVGLTGGIATGKSAIAQEIAQIEGVKAVEVDQLAWETYRPGTQVYQKLVAHFGQNILKSNRTISRRKLGEIVFNDKKELEFLDKTVHPVVTEKLYKLIEREKKRGTKVLVVVAALLLEAKSLNKDIFDYLIVSHLSKEKRIRRLMERDNVNKNQALKRINAQPPQKNKLKKADYVISTSGTLEETRDQARFLINSLLKEVNTSK